MVSELSGSETYLVISYTKLSLCLTFHLFGQLPHRLIPSYWELMCKEIK